MFALDLEQRVAIGIFHTQHGVAGGQPAGDQQRRFQAALDFADLCAGQGAQALFDHCLELLLGAGLHQLLGTLAAIHGVKHQGGNYA
ncbi:hypothetical protein D3C85_1786470 [compost metagenome]